MRIACYMRVSTDTQELQPQRKEIRQFCASRGWQDPEEYADIMSASNFDRKGLAILLSHIQEGKYDVVVSVKLDRLARSLPHFSCLMQVFRDNNVALVLTSQGVDTTNENPMGKMQVGMLAVFAEFERELIRERTIAGLAVAKDAGKKLGKPSVNLVHDYEDVIAKWKLLGGKNYRELAKLLGGVSSATAHRLVNGAEKRCNKYILRKSSKNK